MKRIKRNFYLGALNNVCIPHVPMMVYHPKPATMKPALLRVNRNNELLNRRMSRITAALFLRLKMPYDEIMIKKG